MQIKLQVKTILCLFTLLIVQNVNGADENSTAKPTEATTTKPKVHVVDSALCKKCVCDTDDLLLDCSNGRLKEWFTADDWQTLENSDFTFKTIKLENNSLSEISALPAHPVNNLYLSYNRIEKIGKAAFQNLTELQLLDLSHNNLTSKALTPDTFMGTYSSKDILPLGQMKELNLGANQLHNLDADLFEHFPNLERLILCENVFQVLDQPSQIAISSLTSLKILDLSYMELNKLPDYFLHGPRALETLILTGNLLSDLPEPLTLAINLKELVLDENLISNISGVNSFPALNNLRYLSLSYMPHLTLIANEGFSKLQNLTKLIMTNNPKLSTIEERAFTKNTTNPEIFDYVPLEELHLNNNNLSKIESKLFNRWDKINIIDLRNNPWECDASNHYLINILLVQINRTTPLLIQNLTCGSPELLKSLPLNDPRVAENLKNANTNTVGLAIVCVLVALLVGIPLVIGTVVLYRRGCFGMLYPRNIPAGAHYRRADSAEDLHI